MLALAAIAAADRASGRAHRSLSATVTDAQLEAVLTRLETGVEVSPLEAARNDYETVLQDMAGRDHE
jgi:predicted lipid-binding transport protein (Tim44 family)